jgi:hypothetical protein
VKHNEKNVGILGIGNWAIKEPLNAPSKNSVSHSYFQKDIRETLRFRSDPDKLTNKAGPRALPGRQSQAPHAAFREH